MHKFKRLFAVLSMLIASTLLFMVQAVAQEQPQTAEVMRSNGKIYVVVAVILIILIGLFIYLANLDRKISKLDKGNNE